MARLIRPLRQQWPQLHLHHHRFCCYNHSSFIHLLTSSSSTTSCSSIATPHHVFSLATSSSTHRSFHTWVRRPRFAKPPTSVEDQEGEIGSDSESDAKKSRNEKKREARRAVRWGMELAAFSPPQIKRILRLASLEREVYEGLMLVKKFGPEVKEGKRRQYNYIGKLLRDVQPELMDALIHSTKDGDWSRVKDISGLEMQIDGDDAKEIEEKFEEEEISEEHLEMATRWLDGLVTKDVDITKEVYALPVIDFDRQELRRLLRKVEAVKEGKWEEEEGEEGKKKAAAAKKSLHRFLRILAKQMFTQSSDVIIDY
ncbi:hypothetical protein LINGRAHAP2_LOCUS24139 [Linum grandiflorum]